MKIGKEFKLNGYEQKRTYGNKYIGHVTKYLNCSVTNLKSGITIEGICINSPINSVENETFLSNNYKWSASQHE